jgi:hypothetical protein
MMKSLRSVKVLTVIGVVVVLALALGLSRAFACEICSQSSPMYCAYTGAGYENCSAEGYSCANWEPLCGGGGRGGGPKHQYGPSYWW